MSREPLSFLPTAGCGVNCSVGSNPLPGSTSGKGQRWIIRQVILERGEAVTDNKPMMLYTATYDSVSAAMTDLDAIEQMYKDETIGKYERGRDR
jgi:hypothetical protein